jgi:hypothetical protein
MNGVVDISIHKIEHNIKISIFRKPTFTDTILLQTSNHPTQHKYSAIRYLPARQYKYQLNNKAYIRGLITIQNNNSYPIQPPKTPKTKKKYTTGPDQETPRQKLATFTYVGKETIYITHKPKNYVPHKNSIKENLKKNLNHQQISSQRCVETNLFRLRERKCRPNR